MSVIMTLQATGDPKALEQYSQANAQKMQNVLEAAKRHGIIAHRFYGSDDGSVMVLDEWPDRDSFESFFRDEESEIRPMFEAAGVTGQLEPKYWRQLATQDVYGWGA